ncbi:hypothetical protein GYMLUDRAFT_73068 [Collybiopsis luxurians FD-317 M1]|uniref:Uncharacterized protein n=1 Tax=Collybiopsis luxurians FD-317 M1 TaxID=944289 RepID=A0A0D0CYS6_9AGAR|nr:hypothetical protein GYMLUDRAFT_73068 [Collybiopsis luxurians FD-317 M1]
MSSPQPSLQFEAPDTADSAEIGPIKPVSASQKRPFSIDLSLELERQLEMDSLPPTPAHNATIQSAPVFAQMRDSLDPDVLAHIISQLRRSLADMTKERDDLVNLLSAAHLRGAELEDALQHMTEKATTMEEELMESRRKNKDDEEAISLLRSKVEESRRGLMRLQTENRRQSVITPLDLSRVNQSPPSKRASFTPLAGSFGGRPNGHRRISSVSDSGLQALNLNLGLGLSDPSNNNPQVLSIPSDSLSTNPSPISSRMAGLFAGRPSPPQEGIAVESAELQSLRKQVASLKTDLEETRHELTEAVEAREASDTCVKALRVFIEENNVGTGRASTDSASMKLPPLPSSVTDQEAGTPTTAKAGWGFGKLWSGKPAANGSASAAIEPPTPSAPVQTPTQLSKKIGGFFTRQPSISSTHSTPIPPEIQAAHRASTYSYESRSDSSSIAEPLSPTSDPNDNIVVRDPSSPLNFMGPRMHPLYYTLR